MEISVSKGFRGVHRRGVPASAPESPRPRGRKLGSVRGRCTPPPPRGRFASRGPSAAPRSAGGRPGRGKEVRAAVPGPQCGRLARRTRVDSGLRWRRPAWEARGTQGLGSSFWFGEGTQPLNSHGRHGDASACGSLDSETTHFGSFPPLRTSAGESG